MGQWNGNRIRQPWNVYIYPHTYIFTFIIPRIRMRGSSGSCAVCLLLTDRNYLHLVHASVAHAVDAAYVPCEGVFTREEFRTNMTQETDASVHLNVTEQIVLTAKRFSARHAVEHFLGGKQKTRTVEQIKTITLSRCRRTAASKRRIQTE